MATGSSFGGTLEGSDESFDLVCSPCVKKNRKREATKYCHDCQDYYCSTCVGFHIDIPALAGHKILDQSEFPTDGSLVTLPTEKCQKHPSKLVDMYCQNHDQIGCSVCMAVKHRSCKDVFYIPEEIDNILQVGDTKQVQEDLKKANDELKVLVEARHLDVDTVEKDKTDTLSKIEIFRQTINTTLDKLEKMTRDIFDAKHENIQKKLNSDITLLNDMVKYMEACQQQLQLAEGNRSQQFVCVKKSKQKISQSKNSLKELAKCPTIKIDFQENESIMKLLNGLKSLGDITEKTSCRSVQVQQHSALYKVTGRHEYNVTRGCHEYNLSTRPDHMYGSCILTDGTLLLTNYNMKKLARLDSSTYKVIDECDMSAGPIAVCEISPQEAGVTLYNKTIQLVSLESKMAPTRSIKMSHYCYGLALSNGEMFVSDWGNNVYVYDTSGTLLRTICKDQSGADIFSATRHITVSDDGTKVYVADRDKGVIVLDRNGTVLSRFCDPEWSGACGVCTDGCDNVFVCGYKSNNVVQFGPSGDKVGVIVNQSDNISTPLSLCYDRSTSRMIVTRYNSGHVAVFDMKNKPT